MRERRDMRKRTGESGMTLLEVTIASSVMALALVMTMGSLVGISGTRDIAEDRMMAAVTISSVMEELRTLSYDGLVAYTPPSAEGLGASTAITVAVFDSSGATIQLPVDPDTLSETLPNPLELQVTVFWRDVAGRLISARSSTLVGR